LELRLVESVPKREFSDLVIGVRTKVRIAHKFNKYREMNRVAFAYINSIRLLKNPLPVSFSCLAHADGLKVAACGVFWGMSCRWRENPSPWRFPISEPPNQLFFIREVDTQGNNKVHNRDMTTCGRNLDIVLINGGKSMLLTVCIEKNGNLLKNILSTKGIFTHSD
jgi:hypothetical protein